jgi:tRNA dimethylallyltransferase
MHDIQHYFLILFGPTGVGKTEVALELAQHLPSEIINSDVGQFYTPLSIGTAKPNWRSISIPHHLFDILDKPVDFTVVAYRERFLQTVSQIWQHCHLPLVVGGSSFYIHALFFPPYAGSEIVSSEYAEYDTEKAWQLLYKIDPDRAKQIHPHDRYRIERALAIWHTTGKRPSAFVPRYNPPAPYMLICLTRDRTDLYGRINARTNEMIEAGWIDEVKTLQGTDWEYFVRAKKFIGYSEILDYLEGKRDLEKTVALIQQETRNYAKRQLTFWRRLEKQLKAEQQTPNTFIETVNLTVTDLAIYIKQLSKRIESLLF